MAKKGDWVRLHIQILNPEERAPQVPDDTKQVPLEMWVKGILQSDCEMGQEAEVITRTGRRMSGTLCEVNPKYTHSFGDFIPELMKIGDQARQIVFGGGDDSER